VSSIEHPIFEMCLHVTVLDPVFIYTAAAAVSRLRLKSWVEPFAGRWLPSFIDWRAKFLIAVVGLQAVL